MLIYYVPFSFVRIFFLLSAILHLGNIRYKKKTYRDDSIDICNPEVLPIVSELLEVSSLLRPQNAFSPNLIHDIKGQMSKSNENIY